MENHIFFADFFELVQLAYRKQTIHEKNRGILLET